MGHVDGMEPRGNAQLLMLMYHFQKSFGYPGHSLRSNTQGRGTYPVLRSLC